MLRSFLLILCTVLLLAGAFTIYWFLQPPTALVEPPRPRQLSSGPITTQPTIGVLGSGRQGWVKSFNSAGDLAGEFFAERYDPQPDSTIRVEKPQAKIYLPHGQYLWLTGETGTIVVDQSDTGGSGSPFAASGPMTPPRRGELHQVNIALYPALDAPSPTLTVELNNAAFDMETFRIYTEAYREEKSGKLIEADQVPVQVYGIDYEFSGRGLTIRWNELRGRLELLEIAHGEKLILKNPGKLISPVAHAPPRLPGEQDEKQKAYLSSLLASADNTAIADALPTATGPATRPAQPVYRAVFHDNIRIIQNQTPLASGDQLEIDFLPKQGEQAAIIATRPAVPASTPATAPVPTPATMASSQPASAPADRGPITVYWTGPLRITPLADSSEKTLPPGEAIVRLLGSPVHLQQQTGQIECARLQYRTADQTLLLTQSGSSPIVLQDARGSTIQAARMELDRVHNRAILSGAGSARLSNSQPATDGEKDEPLTARWTTSCTLQFASAAGDALLIQSAFLQGDVDVQTPQLKLRSDALELTMAPPAASKAPATQPADLNNVQLQRALATGNVHCILSSPQGDQNILAQRLEVLTATTDTGRFYPRTVRADGQVKADSADRTLAAGHVEVTLIPSADAPAKSTTKVSDEEKPADLPPLQIQEMFAQDQVLITSADGATASADQIRVSGSGVDQRILLLGQPLAKITNKDNALSGQLIEVHPQQQQVFIRGPGSISARQAAKGSGTPQTADISWTQSAYIDGQTNLGEAIGGVSISSPDSDGSVRSASAGRIKLHLADAAPSTQPTTRPVDTQAAQLDLMGRKILQSVDLLDEVEIKSEQLAGGQILRGMNLHTSAAEYHATTGQFVVPGPGRMLVEDHRPTTQPTQPAGPLSSDASGFRGMTALQWQKQFIFDPRQHQALIEGEVRIVQEPAGDSSRRRELSADRVTVNFASAPATTPDTDEAAQMQLASVQAKGSIYFKTEGIECRAALVEFDAARHLLHASGDSTQRGELLDGQGLSRGGFDELWFDTETQNLQVTGAHGQVRP